MYFKSVYYIAYSYGPAYQFHRFRTNVTILFHYTNISLTIHSITMSFPHSPHCTAANQTHNHSIDIKSNAILSTGTQVPIMLPSIRVRFPSTAFRRSHRLPEHPEPVCIISHYIKRSTSTLAHGDIEIEVIFRSLF